MIYVAVATIIAAIVFSYKQNLAYERSRMADSARVDRFYTSDDDVPDIDFIETDIDHYHVERTEVPKGDCGC